MCVGSLTLTGSALYQNHADHGGGLGGGNNNECTQIVTNSTLVLNSANTQGGGIYNFGPVTLTYATVYGQLGPQRGRDFPRLWRGSAQQIDCGWRDPRRHVDQQLLDHIVRRPQSRSAAEQQGPYAVMLPGPGSFATIDIVPAASCSLATDQRGVALPQGSACDAGAVEVKVPKLTATVVGSGSVSAGASPAPSSGSISNCTTSCSAFLSRGCQCHPDGDCGHWLAFRQLERRLREQRHGDDERGPHLHRDVCPQHSCDRRQYHTNLAGSGLKLHLSYGVGHDEDLTPINGAHDVCLHRGGALQRDLPRSASARSLRT